MKSHNLLPTLLGVLLLTTLDVQGAFSQAASVPAGVDVYMVITDGVLSLDKELPPLQKEDVKVKQGKTFLKVTQLIPAQGETAALQLMILIDDTLNSSVGNNLTDIKDFVAAQPPSTIIGIGYMSNAGVNVVQNFTPDKDLAVKAIRLPRSNVSTMDSPYLSLISLVKGWQQQKVRRVVLMVTDGIDRLRGEKPELSLLSPRYGTAYHSMPTISQDATSASEASQRYNVLVYSLYAAGVGRAGRSSWDLQLGLSGLSKIAEETGGEVFSLGTSQLVSFKPHLDNFQKMLGNQYYVVFQAVPKKKAGFQRVKVETELPNSEILAPDNVWVPAAAK
ncbi:MAG TPA: hypothetical protein VFE61_28785 [Candidatus Sulfotelmatobacter sp.]|jgi:hypothetical protein|nr:hypothetical protein [Candidatus Sulfotelmatobacter sp.]